MINLSEMSLKNKLHYSFILVTGLTIFITTAFSVMYFLGKIKNEATYNMKKNLKVTEMIYTNKKNEIVSFTSNLSNDKAIQVLTDLDIRNKLSEYIKEVVKREKIYNITILNSAFDVMTSSAIATNSIVKHQIKADFKDNDIIEKAVKTGKVATGTETVALFDYNSILSISSAAPIIRDEKIVGYLSVRYILNDDNYFAKTLKNLLDVDYAIYHDVISVVSSDERQIDDDLYAKVVASKKNIEIANLVPGGFISEYTPVFDITGKTLAVLRISIPSSPYFKMMLNASINFMIIMIVCVIISYFLVFILSKSILVPINNLLNGVNKITEGDLSYEIMTDLKDEIGKLSQAFNNMRLTLSDKISTIENMNENLESTIIERTRTIQSLLNKMKKYLAPQLYDSIIGGKTSIDTKKHMRKKLSVFFSDIVSFTSTTEGMEPEDLSEILNTYLDNMAKIAIKWGGTIDKFIGDAIMVFFGDPEFVNDKDHAYRAAMMAIEMRDRMKELRYYWKEQGIHKPLHIRMGINTGYCTVGNFGSENRMDYTIIGSHVNLAARFEAAADADAIYISYETYSLIKDQIQCEPVGDLQLKGISEPVSTFKVINELGHSKKSRNIMKVDKDGIVFNSALIDPKSISDDEKRDIIKSLKSAIYLVAGKTEKLPDDNNPIS